jgi:hypothetical protein
MDTAACESWIGAVGTPEIVAKQSSRWVRRDLRVRRELRDLIKAVPIRTPTGLRALLETDAGRACCATLQWSASSAVFSMVFDRLRAIEVSGVERAFDQGPGRSRHPDVAVLGADV